MFSNDCDDAVICCVSHTRSGGWERLWPEARSEHYQGEYHQLEARKGRGWDQMKRINKSKNFPVSITHVLVSTNFCLIQAFWHLKHFHGKNFVEFNVKWEYFPKSLKTSSLSLYSQQLVQSGLWNLPYLSIQSVHGDVKFPLWQCYLGFYW